MIHNVSPVWTMAAGHGGWGRCTSRVRWTRSQSMSDLMILIAHFKGNLFESLQICLTSGVRWDMLKYAESMLSIESLIILSALQLPKCFFSRTRFVHLEFSNLKFFVHLNVHYWSCILDKGTTTTKSQDVCCSVLFPGSSWISGCINRCRPELKCRLLVSPLCPQTEHMWQCVRQMLQMSCCHNTIGEISSTCWLYFVSRCWSWSLIAWNDTMIHREILGK